MNKDDLLSGPARRAWAYFFDICAVPRPSKHEEKIQAWLEATAAANGWELRRDTVGNIVIAVPGCGALKDASPLVLQGHMDMVCEKNADIAHDFMNDPISTRIENGWIVADQTTLGADNGVAMAMGLAVAAEDLVDRLPLELLFTTDEETGLTGALNLDPTIVHGRHLLNLDSEEDGVFVIGCVGGVDMRMHIPLENCEPAADLLLCMIRGFRGGHSGINILEGRTNAILFAGDVLCELQKIYPEMKLHALNGGSKKNAIPRETSFVISGIAREEVECIVSRLVADIRNEEPDADWELMESTEALHHNIPLSVITVLNHLPNGVLAMEPDYPELARTSTSLGVATTDKEGLHLQAHGRSSSLIDKDELCTKMEKSISPAGGAFEKAGEYPGWEPFADAAIVAHGVNVYRNVFGKEPTVEGIHAGLEAGIIGNILGTRELLSCGPTIENAHSPDERLNIESFERNYAFLKAFVSTPLEI